MILNLLNTYDKVMYLKIFTNNEELKERYENAARLHNAKILDPNNKFLDAGFDLFVPTNIFSSSNDDNYDNNNNNNNNYDNNNYDNNNNNNNNNNSLIKIDHEVICSAKMFTDQNKMYSTGFYMDPRSSISKTSYRLANSRGIIDSGYRGNLIGVFDVLPNQPQTQIEKFDRLLQICGPGLEPIFVVILDRLSDLGEETLRGTGGIGSSGR
jgi:hypothetical protein